VVANDERWLYMAVHKDLFTSEALGHAMGERLTRNLINQSLLQAVTTRKPEKGATAPLRPWQSILQP